MNLENAQVAMQIIMHAGDARVKTMEALKALKTFDVATARQSLQEGKEDLVKAHTVQTDALQAEARGEEVEFSLLFSHAQDTCMTVCSEMNIAEQLIDICEGIDKRFQALENR